jgi:glutamine amidotransferase-like uncharacterized protein
MFAVRSASLAERATIVAGAPQPGQERVQAGAGTGMGRKCIFIAVLAAASVSLPSSSARQTGSEPILLFEGTGASPGSVSALRAVLEANHLTYTTVTSAELDRMDEAALQQHRLLIVPGGNFVDMGNGISRETVLRIRDAVHHGLNYLGVCAGAFLAGDSPYNGINLTTGVRFQFYSDEAKGIRKAAVAITSAEGTRLEHYWEDGPQLTGWGEVVARYPDGASAIAQGAVGSGWAVLTGVHPEAPEKWRYGMRFTTPARVDNEYAARLIRAALERERLPHF